MGDTIHPVGHEMIQQLALKQMEAGGSCGNLRFQPHRPIVGAVLIYLVNHVLLFCKTKQEILLRHMRIITPKIYGYCHARVHAGVTPLYIFFSSYLVSSRCSC